MTYIISSENIQVELNIQKMINDCLDNFESFCFDAGAGAGKTYALQKSIEHILKIEGENLKQNNQKILCITYTNAAKDEILERIGRNSSVVLSTIHEFLWGFIAIQQELLMIEHEGKIKKELEEIKQTINENSFSNSINLDEFQEAIDEKFLEIFYNTPLTPAQNFKEKIIGYNEYFKDYLKNVSKFSDFVKKCVKKRKLENTLEEIESKKTNKIIYNPVQNRDKLDKYVISHDTLLLYSKNIITSQNILKRLFSDRYPYVLVDEYQDTDRKVIDIMDSIREYSNTRKKFMVGFFGDSLQSIYGSGVGILPNKHEYKIIEKKFNRRSSKQIVELIEKIRNDNFGQQSIYNDFDNGSYKFYVTDDNFDLTSFLQKNNLTNNTSCLLMKNDDITKARGFDEILTVLKKFPRFSGSNFDKMTNEFLQKNLQHMGWFLREVINFVDFIQKVSDGNSTVKEIVQFIESPKSSLTFGEMKHFVDSINKFDFSKMTLFESIDEVRKINERISGEKILRKIFSIDDIAQNLLLSIQNRAYDYFYFSQQTEEETETSREMNSIDEFFRIQFSQFMEWYKYIFGDLKNEGINYYTLHGSKGLEFDNVVVVLQDNFAREKDYCKYFFENYSNQTDDDTRYKAVRNLLYVACSRAKIKLFVVYISKIEETCRVNIENIFGKIQYLDID